MNGLNHNWQAAALTGRTEDHLISFGAQRIHPAIKIDLECLMLAANNAGFTLAIASSFRSFARQQAIWDAKFNGLRPLLDRQGKQLDSAALDDDAKISAILHWSALPGASRHHWGTDLDIYASNLLPQNEQLQLEPWEYLAGHQQPFYLWLQAHLSEFGFYFPYQKDTGGIAPEPWHISHRATSASALEALDYEVLQQAIEQSQVAGRNKVLTKLEYIYHHYVQNVN